MSFTDKTLVCRDCKQNFTFTAGEQEFYANKGLRGEADYAERAEAAGREVAIAKIVQSVIEGVQSKW